MVESLSKLKMSLSYNCSTVRPNTNMTKSVNKWSSKITDRSIDGDQERQ